MGGIAGVCHLDGFPASEKDLKRMCRLLAHRGPNGKGVHIDREGGLAHTRLAVFDLSDRGLQPMSGVGERYWIVHDGEIYNFLELKQELKRLGYPFKTDTDTEVILAAYMAWGPQCIEQFQGIWAFAIWDAQERVFFLARDRFGCKPLYYYCNHDLFAFASEIKGFLGIASLSLQYDGEALANAFAYPSLIEGMEKTLWKGIKRLLPGHTLIISKNAPSPQLSRWWHTLSHLPEISPWPNRQKEVFHTHLMEACREAMRSDVPAGFCMSGGIESTSLFACAQEVGKNTRSLERVAPDFRTALVMQLGEEKKSKSLNELIAEHKGHLVTFRKDMEQLGELALDLIYHFEEVGPFDLGRWLFFQVARQENIRVCLEGVGAEVVCAMPLVFAEKRAEDCFIALKNVAHVVERLSGGVKGKEWVFDVGREGVLAPFDPFQIPFLRYEGDLLHGKGTPFCSPIWEEDVSQIASMERAFQLQYFLSHAGYLQTHLRRLDLAGMAHGVEARCPFLDWKVVVYSLALPFATKIGEGSYLGILQEVMRGVLSEKLLKRAPVSYSFPGVAWLEGSLRALVEKCAESRAFQEFPFWDGRRVSQLAREGDCRQLWPYFQAYFLYMRFREMRERIFGEG